MNQPTTSSREISAPLISVCMVVHNEAENLRGALESVAGWAEELVVIDCESTDGTGHTAQQFGAKLTTHPNGEPDRIKNRAFEMARGEWILSLDADEEIPSQLRDEILAKVKSAPAEAAFKIPRRNHYFGTPLMHGGNYPDKQLRLFRKGTGRYPGNRPHERIEIAGEVGELQNAFNHFPYRDFETYLRKLDFYTSFAAEEFLANGLPITPSTIRRYMVARPLRRWLERLFLKRGIRDGVPGVLAATHDLMTNVISFGKYWHLVNTRPRNEL